MNYYESETKQTERFACQLLNQVGIKCDLNNVENITAVDLKTETGLKIDVQFSKNFDIYGDYRLDIISAYETGEFHNASDFNHSTLNYRYDYDLTFKGNFEKKYQVKVTKSGKIFQKDYLDALIIFFYNGKEINNSNLNKILIIKKGDLIDFLSNNKERLFSKIKLNDKRRNGLSDRHGSAFIPISVDELAKQTKCILTALENFLSESEKIKEYLS